MGNAETCCGVWWGKEGEEGKAESSRRTWCSLCLWEGDKEGTDLAGVTPV